MCNNWNCESFAKKWKACFFNIFCVLISCNCYLCKLCDVLVHCCKYTPDQRQVTTKPDDDAVRLVVGSCYTTQAIESDRPWKKMLTLRPDLMILGGDNVYINWYWCCPSFCGCNCLGCNVANNRGEEDEEEAEFEYYKNEYDRMLKQYHDDMQLVIDSDSAEKDLELKKEEIFAIPVIDNHDGREIHHAGGMASTEGFVYLFNELHKNKQVSPDLSDQIDKMGHERGRYYYYDHTVQHGDPFTIRVVALDVFWIPDNDDQQPLGKDQWNWLEEHVVTKENNNDYDWLVIVSGDLIGGPQIKNLWSCLPKCCQLCKPQAIPNRQWRDPPELKLYDLLDRVGVIDKTILVSGDIHASGVYKTTYKKSEHDHEKEIYELTASAFTHSILNYQMYCCRFALCLQEKWGKIRTDDCKAHLSVPQEISPIININGFGVLDITKRGWTYKYVDNDHRNLKAYAFCEKKLR